jgi:cytochrome c
MSITIQKIVGAVLFVLIFIIAMNMIVDPMFPGIRPLPPAAPTAATAGGETAAAGTAAAAPARPLAERLAAATPDKGKAVAAKCLSCHNFDPGGGTKVGPGLYGVFGRPKGSVAGFAYSAGMKSAGGTWTEEDLDKFLTKPKDFVNGTKMTFAGLPDGDDRANVIAFLRSLSAGGKSN